MKKARAKAESPGREWLATRGGRVMITMLELTLTVEKDPNVNTLAREPVDTDTVIPGNQSD